MSKELNIIQAIEMPVGTKFNFDVDKNARFVEILKGDDEPKILCWNGEKDMRVRICTSTARMKLIPIQQPVSFMEAIKADYYKKCKVDFSQLELRDVYKDRIERFSNKYENFGKLLFNLSNNFPTSIFKLILSDGKWYIEESEEN